MIFNYLQKHFSDTDSEKLEKLFFGFLIFITTFGVYLTTISPTIYWRDSSEFVATAFELGISHPSGSPLYSSLANIFTYLPFGSVPFRVNIFSAICCSLITVIIFFTSSAFLNLYFTNNKTSKNNNFISLYISIIFAFSTSLWDLSGVAEVYPLQYIFVALIFYLFIKIHTNISHQEKLIYLTGFLLGISSGAHIVMLFYLPASIILLYFFSKNFRKKECWPVFTFFLILGGSIYIYLPIRSMSDTFWDWGNTEKFINFIIHVTDKKDSSTHTAYNIESLISTLKIYFGFLWKDFSATGIILATAGFIYGLKKNKKIILFPIILVLVQWCFFIRYWKWSTQYLPTFMVIALFMGLGIKWILEFIEINGLNKRIKQLVPLIVILGLMQTSLLFLNYKDVNKNKYWAPREFFNHILNQFEDGSVVMSQWTSFGLAYMSNVEGARPTISHINPGDIITPDTFSQLDNKRYPLLKIPKSYGNNGADIGSKLMSINNNKRFYWEPVYKLDYIVSDISIQNGFFYILDSNPEKYKQNNILQHDSRITAILNREYTIDQGPFIDKNESEIISMVMSGIAAKSFKEDDFNKSILLLSALRNIAPDNATIINTLGAAYASVDIYEEAEKLFKQAAKLAPTSSESLKNLAKLYESRNENKKAIEIYQKAISLSPEDHDLKNKLQEVEQRLKSGKSKV